MAKIKTLRAHPLFASLSDRELALFSRIVQEGDHPAGEILLSEGKESSSFFLVQKGKVAVQSRGVEGQSAAMGEGESLGQWALLGPQHPAAVTARVVEDSSLLSVSREDFLRFLAQDPATGLAVVRALVGGAWADALWVRENLSDYKG